MHETILCQKTDVLAATSNLRVKQNLVHLGRFLHFSRIYWAPGIEWITEGPRVFLRG